MKITITDHRSESRDRSCQRDIDGTVLSGTSDADRKAYHRVYNNTHIHDDRAVTVRIEDTDHAAGIPEWIEIEGDRQVFGYFVQIVSIGYQRSGNDDGKYTDWHQTVTVSGDNRKKDGTPGLKPQRFAYPTQSPRQVGVWTEADINPDLDPQSWWGKKERERVGSPRMERMPDPMPGWLQAILDRVHPETGELAYRWTPTHLFGDFVEHSWNPEVGIELQGVTR